MKEKIREKKKKTETEEVGLFQVEGKETEIEEDYSTFKKKRQRRRKTVPGGRKRDMRRGRLFRLEEPDTEKEESYFG